MSNHHGAHIYQTPAPHIVAEGVDPRECGECGQDHPGHEPGDMIPVPESLQYDGTPVRRVTVFASVQFTAYVNDDESTHWLIGTAIQDAVRMRAPYLRDFGAEDGLLVIPEDPEVHISLDTPASEPEFTTDEALAAYVDGTAGELE